MCTTHPEIINPDLLAFFRGGHRFRLLRGTRRRDRAQRMERGAVMSDHVDGPRLDRRSGGRPHRPVRVHQPGEPCPHGARRRACFPSAGDERDVLERRQSLDRRSPRDRRRPRRRGEVPAGGPGDPLQLPVRRARAQTPRARPVQRGTCTLPDGRELPLVVNDEKGASTPDGVFRVFAGLRSDPFFLAWDVGGAQEVPEPAAARQRALHRRRVRYTPRARSRARARCSA